MTTLKTLLFAFTAAILLSGCVSTEQFNALEARVGQLESQLASAKDSAGDASSVAQQASRDASAAQSTAKRAMDAANEANERAECIADTCCSRK